MPVHFLFLGQVTPSLPDAPTPQPILSVSCAPHPHPAHPFEVSFDHPAEVAMVPGTWESERPFRE